MPLIWNAPSCQKPEEWITINIWPREGKMEGFSRRDFACQCFRGVPNTAVSRDRYVRSISIVLSTTIQQTLPFQIPVQQGDASCTFQRLIKLLRLSLPTVSSNLGRLPICLERLSSRAFQPATGANLDLGPLFFLFLVAYGYRVMKVSVQ